MGGGVGGVRRRGSGREVMEGRTVARQCQGRVEECITLFIKTTVVI